MDRATRATAPIIMPMPSDRIANWMVPAMPTAAISAWMPRREIQKSARKSTRKVKDSPSAPESDMTAT